MNISHNATPKGRSSDEHAEWMSQSKSIVMRGLGNPEAYNHIGLDLLVDHAAHEIATHAEHSWSVHNNALLALLSGQRHHFLAQHHSSDIAHWEPKPELIEAAQRLAGLGYDPLQKSALMGNADALDYAVSINAVPLVREWGKHVDIQARALRGASWLHFASASAMHDMCRELVLMGMDPNMRDQDGNTPLFFAPNPSTIRCLLEIGADPALRNHDKLDARTFIRNQNKKLTKAELAEITKAIGGVQSPQDRADVIAQFEALAWSASGKALMEEAGVIGMPADAVFSDGHTILGQAAARYLPHFCNKVTLKGRVNAVGWMRQSLEWTEAVEAASLDDLAMTWVLGNGTGHPYWQTVAEKEFKRRGVAHKALIQTAAVRVIEATIAQKKQKERWDRTVSQDQMEPLLLDLLATPTDIDLGHMTWCLGSLSQYPPDPEIARQLFHLSDGWAGWADLSIMQKFIDLTLTFPVHDVAEAREYSNLISKFKPASPDALVELIEMMRRSLDDNPASESRQLIQAHYESMTLSTQTAPISTPRKPGARL